MTCASCLELESGLVTGACVEATRKVVWSFFPLDFDDVHMRLDRSFTFPETVAGQVAAAKTAFAYAPRALHFPNARLQTNAGHVLPALFTVEVIYIVLHLIEHDYDLPLRGGVPEGRLMWVRYQDYRH